MIDLIFSFINRVIEIKSPFDVHILIVLISFFFFLILSFFLIQKFKNKIIFLKISLILFVIVIISGSLLPGSARDIKYMENLMFFEYILKFVGVGGDEENLKREYEYIYHYVSDSEEKIYYLLKDLKTNNLIFVVSDLNEEEKEKIDQLIRQNIQENRRDQNKRKGVKIILERFGFKSFEKRIESYDIKAHVPDLKKY